MTFPESTRAPVSHAEEEEEVWILSTVTQFLPGRDGILGPFSDELQQHQIAISRQESKVRAVVVDLGPYRRAEPRF